MPALRTGLRVLGVLASLGAAFLGFAYWYDRTGQRADPAFDTSVASPAYAADGPTILFDVAHRNWHTPTDR